jgi:aspartyl-tRNA(Asn)/glutamyl-tRNA(Gln) amidotransferase subunit A
MTMPKTLNNLTAHEIRGALRAGAVTATQIAEAYFSRIAEIDPEVRAYVDVWRDYGLAQAAKVDETVRRGDDPGPLAGVPIGLKDVLCTRQGYTTCCSKILKGYRSPFDATVVERLEAAGGVFLGKLNMDEFAMGSSTRSPAIRGTSSASPAVRAAVPQPRWRPTNASSRWAATPAARSASPRPSAGASA